MGANIPSTTIEELEYILLHPDTYIGSTEKHTQNLWVYENEEMVNRSISYVPGLYKIFDEILVNAADNKQRDPSMDSLKVTIDPEANTVSVYNNGDGVPVEIHQEEKVYVPELIFGHLLTSSNYDDNVKKTTGGRNGYGAKLTNIFSTEFVIETADGRRLKKYKQVVIRFLFDFFVVQDFVVDFSGGFDFWFVNCSVILFYWVFLLFEFRWIFWFRMLLGFLVLMLWTEIDFEFVDLGFC